MRGDQTLNVLPAIARRARPLENRFQDLQQLRRDIEFALIASCVEGDQDLV
jgi:hypothetical protein